MKALVPFLLIQGALLFCAAVMGAVAVRAHYEQSSGFRAMLYPFSILFMSGLVEGLRVLAGLLGLGESPFTELASGFRLLNGLGWFLMCHEHLKLHGILGWRGRLNAPVIGATAASVLFYALSLLFGRAEIALAIGLSLMSATALYAALTAILVLRKGIRLWPSSRAGIRMAVFALVSYPVLLIAERLGFKYPFLDPDRAIFEQLFPLFITVFGALAVPALLTQAKGLLAEPGDARAALSLSRREREIALLLREGKSLKEIAIQLSLAVSTVKSHANVIYRKLGVSGKSDLLLIHFD